MAIFQLLEQPLAGFGDLLEVNPQVSHHRDEVDLRLILVQYPKRFGKLGIEFGEVGHSGR